MPQKKYTDDIEDIGTILSEQFALCGVTVLHALSNGNRKRLGGLTASLHLSNTTLLASLQMRQHLWSHIWSVA